MGYSTPTFVVFSGEFDMDSTRRAGWEILPLHLLSTVVSLTWTACSVGGTPTFVDSTPTFVVYSGEFDIGSM